MEERPQVANTQIGQVEVHDVAICRSGEQHLPSHDRPSPQFNASLFTNFPRNTVVNRISMSNSRLQCSM